MKLRSLYILSIVGLLLVIVVQIGGMIMLTTIPRKRQNAH